jgi:hypothetical protein
MTGRRAEYFRGQDRMNDAGNQPLKLAREVKAAVRAGREVGFDEATIRAHIGAITRPCSDHPGAAGDFLRALIAKATADALAETL